MALSLRSAEQSRARSARGTRPAHWLTRAQAPYAVLFLLLLFAYSYTPPRWQDWNQNSRLDLTLAIVERGTVRIDAYGDNTGDYATIDGHRYTDKAPGLSLVAIPAYGLIRILQTHGLDRLTQRLGSGPGFTTTLRPEGAGINGPRIDLAIALYLLAILTVGSTAAGLGVLVALVLARLWGCRTAGVLTALILGLATPIFPYAQAFYGHLPTATCLFAAFALLVLRPTPLPSDRVLVAFGALLALAVVIEYPAAVTALPVVVWALTLARWRAVFFGTLGASGPLLILAAYDLIAFGTPLPIGYAHSTLWQTQHQQGFLSLTYPKWDALWGLAFSPFRGLFVLAPVLLLVLPGAWQALRQQEGRMATIVALASFGATVLFTASSAMWWGGFAVGPRYLLPGLPFLAVPLGALIAWANGHAGRARLMALAPLGALSAVSLALVWATTFAHQSYPPDSISAPLTDYVLPALREGDIARNIGMAVQLQGVSSLLPLVFVLAVGSLLLAITLLPARAVEVTA